MPNPGAPQSCIHCKVKTSVRTTRNTGSVTEEEEKEKVVVEEEDDTDLLIFSCRSQVGCCRDLEAVLRCEKSSWASTVTS